MVFAVAVQTKGLGFLLVAAMWRNRAFEAVDRAKDASFEALPSELGVKWNVHHGCSASQAST
jgi:hypothetical protein